MAATTQVRLLVWTLLLLGQLHYMLRIRQRPLDDLRAMLHA